MAIFRVTVGIVFAGDGSPGANVWHYRADSSQPELALMEDLEDGLTSLRAFYTALQARYNTTTVLTIPEDIVRVDVTPPAGVPFTATTMTGTGSGSQAPEMLAHCINWYTAVRTRSGHGRTFIGPVTSVSIDTDGTPLNTAAAAVETAADNLIAAGAASDANGAFGVYSRVEGVIRDFTQASVRADKFAVLRSRRD